MSQPKPKNLNDALATIEALTTENARLTADNAALGAKVEQLTTDNAALGTKVEDVTRRLQLLESSANVHADGYINADTKFKALDTENKALRDAMKALEASVKAQLAQQQLRGERTWAQRSAGNAGTGTGMAPAEAPPTTNTAMLRGHQRAHHQQQQQHQPLPSDTVTAKFVAYASADIAPSEVHEKLAHTLGYSTSSILSVQKLMTPAARAALAAAAASTPSAAAAAAAPPTTPSTSAAPTPSPVPNTPAAPAPRRMVNVPFVITTTKQIVDQALKGNLRQLLQEQQIHMYVDDYLTKEEQQERKRREPERLQLKAEGIKTAWRKDALVKRVVVEGKGAWVVVPAPPPQAAADIPATAST
jgi:hypothetical protein